MASIHCNFFGHRGLPALAAAIEVNLAGLVPALSHSHISYQPDLSDIKAIFWPSGEIWGHASLRVDAIRRVGEISVTPPPDAVEPEIPARQMFKSPTYWL
jgi:hypothetical protein